ITVLNEGLWYARSQEFILGHTFQTLTWARIFGGALFVLGGILPLTWFVVSRARNVKTAIVAVDQPAKSKPFKRPILEG
ncbi:MAG: hypothetical protein GTO41_12445, partial [Burkholderiales bacterium]|nr:hypothetical protein [Burkholderiales bacterium]